MRKDRKRIVLWIGLGSLLLILLLFFISKHLGRSSMTEITENEIDMRTLEDGVLEEGGQVISYQGKKYVYDQNITSILCMGIDTSEALNEDRQIGSAGQADALFLLILDTESGKVNLWNISRDSMTEVDIYNIEGNYVRTEQLQACLAYAYGDGMERSCENTVRAVSRLLYGMPIQSYLAVNMNVLVPLNDVLGGVEVTIHEEDILPERFKAGTTVLLQGEDVETYIRSRRTEGPDEPIDTNHNRMERQRQYLLQFMSKAAEKTKEDVTIPLKLFETAKQEGNMVTNLDLSKVLYLTSLFTKIDAGEEGMKTVPGEVKAGEVYAEYHVDDEALYEMILETFYIEK